jgi:hypothetical protein
MFPGFTAGASLSSNGVLARMHHTDFLRGCVMVCISLPCYCVQEPCPCSNAAVVGCVRLCQLASIFIGS